MNFAKEIMQLPILIKESSKEMKKVKSICGCAMLTTLNVVAGTFFIPLSPTLRIGFSSIFAGVHRIGRRDRGSAQQSAHLCQ